MTHDIDVVLDGTAPAFRVRRLKLSEDRDLARSVYAAGSDYLKLETGAPATDETVDRFFHDRPPTSALSDKLPLGILDLEGRGLGVLDCLLGHPEPADLYVGLLMLVPEARGSGLGKRVLDWLVGWARRRGVRRLLVCVLVENDRGRAFWAREGFDVLREVPPTSMGSRTHARLEIVRELGAPEG